RPPIAAALDLRGREPAQGISGPRGTLAAVARMDERRKRMKVILASLATLAALAATPSAAQSAREYFVARTARNEAPPQLSQQDREYYGAVFAAIDRQDWNGAASLLAQRSDGLLHPVARAELYLAAGSPRVEPAQIEAWMPTGRDLPQAQRLARLAL